MVSQECGCRVKTYSQGPGHVRNITWQDNKMTDTGGCVTIDANYKPPPKHPTNYITVSDLKLINVKGTGCKDSPNFICPKQSPCTGIVLEDVVLLGAPKHSKGDHWTGVMDCSYAEGTASGQVKPSSCLK